MNYVGKDISLWKLTIWDKNFNNVPREWQKNTIKYNYLLSDELDSLKIENGNVRILYTGKEIGYTTEELAGQNLFEGEIVSIPWGGIPTVKYCKGKFVTGDNRIATSSDTSKLLNKYLYYYMKGNIKLIESFYRGASLKHPNMKDILSMKISYPSINDQMKVCQLFQSLESLIVKQKAQLKLLDKLIKSRFVEMFGDMIINDRGWKKTSLGNACDIRDGTHDSPQYYNEGYPLITSKNLSCGNIDFNGCNYISKSDYDKINERSKVDFGDVLMPMIGTIGNPIIVNSNAEFAIKNVALIKFDNNSSLINVFVMTLLKSDYFDRLVISKIRGGTQKFISLGDIRKLPVVLPPIELQNQFATFVKQVDKSKFVCKYSLKLIYKMSLIWKLVGK